MTDRKLLSARRRKVSNRRCIESMNSSNIERTSTGIFNGDVRCTRKTSAKRAWWQTPTECALILLETSALYKLFIYLLTYLLNCWRLQPRTQSRRWQRNWKKLRFCKESLEHSRMSVGHYSSSEMLAWEAGMAYYVVWEWTTAWLL